MTRTHGWLLVSLLGWTPWGSASPILFYQTPFQNVSAASFQETPPQQEVSSQTLAPSAAVSRRDPVLSPASLSTRTAPPRCVRVALTFDDGPTPGHTDIVLDVLRRHGVHATFFMLGQQARRYPYLVREVVNDGHEIAVHGDTHRELTKLSLSAANADVKRATITLEMFGQPLSYWRAPYGSRPLHMTYPSEAGLVHVGWTVDSLDWKRQGVDAEWERVQPMLLRDQAIILFHDHATFTPETVDRLLTEGLASGLRFGTVSMLRNACDEQTPPSSLGTSPERPSVVFDDTLSPNSKVLVVP